MKKVFLEISQNSHENILCQSLFFNKVEFCEISKNTFSYRTTPVAASLWMLRKIFRDIRQKNYQKLSSGLLRLIFLFKTSIPTEFSVIFKV